MKENPYATKNGGPKRRQFAEWFVWEQAQAVERRAKMTLVQFQTEDESRRQLHQHMQAESDLINFI